MSKKNKIDKNTIPEDFTLGLAAVDAIPVVFFGASALMIRALFPSNLYLLGAILCFAAGVSKVLWKFIVVLRRKNIWSLFLQMRILMPIGFLLILISLAVNRSRIRPAAMAEAFLSFPSVVFFGIGILGMLLMMVFAVRLDSSDVRSNWIEQITNGIAQICFFIGICLLI